MRKAPYLLAIATVLVATVAVGQSARPSTIGVDEIHPGMHGYGLTVMRGMTPERFDVEVIDVLHDFQPDQDLILIRTDHPILDHATTVAGMSGSPIYLDGRLAGAYAYGWPFGKDPVAGVTPIANMLAEMRRPIRPDAFPGAQPLPTARRGRAAPSSARLAGLPAYRGIVRRTAFDTLRMHAEHGGTMHRAGDARGLERAATPIMLGGFTEGVARQLDGLLEPLGFVTLQAGGAGHGEGGRRGERTSSTAAPSACSSSAATSTRPPSAPSPTSGGSGSSPSATR